MDPEIIPVKDIDYLDEDKPIKGQNYVCLSFISPEEVLKDKDVFFFEKFTENYSKSLSNLLDKLKEKYPDDSSSIDQLKEGNDYLFDPEKISDQFKFFKNIKGNDLEREFHEKNKFKTSIRGLKVRGVFDNLNEAKIRAEVLKRMGDKFDIFVGQVGCWCPWSPNPEDLTDQEYAESQLNTLMKKYKDNLTLRDQEYEERKQQKIKKAQEDYEKKKTQQDNIE